MKNIKYIIIFMLILLFSIFIFPLTQDEIWTYGFTYNIVTGSIPYKDFNMVITPFYPYFMSIFLLIYNNILTMYIINSLIFTIIFYLLEKMYKDNSYILIILFFMPIALVMLNYNSLLLLFLILLIYLEQSKYKNKDYLIGLIIALSILTKQSVGIFFIIPSIIFYKKIDIKKRLIAFIIPMLLFLIYLLIFNNFNSFIDLCFLGLFDFTGNSNGINIILILFLILLIGTIYIIKNNKKDMIGYYVLCFYSIIIPLFDFYHFMFCIFGFLLLILKYYDKKVLNTKLLFIGIYIGIVLSIIINEQTYIKTTYPNNIKHLEYKYLKQDNINNINKISKYIKNKKVIIYDGDSYIYRIVNDDKIGYLDLVNHGNYGYDGSKKIVNDIKKKKDYLILIDMREKNKIDKHKSQLDKKGYYYIINNGKKVGRIEQYTIYKLD